MSAPRFLDTNILLYSISRDPTEAHKRDIAIALLDADDIALSVQVLQEFYVQATRATRPDAIAHDLAVGLMRTWLRFEIQEITLPVMTGALDIRATYGLSYWDAAIVAAARALGCRELYSEDMSHGREIESVTINNPFR
jgi:predicted nucleic acid-binding protein